MHFTQTIFALVAVSTYVAPIIAVAIGPTSTTDPSRNHPRDDSGQNSAPQDQTFETPGECQAACGLLVMCTQNTDLRYKCDYDLTRSLIQPQPASTQTPTTQDSGAIDPPNGMPLLKPRQA